MISSVVLGQYVKVLFSEHGLELCDVGGVRATGVKTLNLTVEYTFQLEAYI